MSCQKLMSNTAQIFVHGRLQSCCPKNYDSVPLNRVIRKEACSARVSDVWLWSLPTWDFPGNLLQASLDHLLETSEEKWQKCDFIIWQHCKTSLLARNLIKTPLRGGRHSTEEAFAVTTQPSQDRFSAPLSEWTVKIEKNKTMRSNTKNQDTVYSFHCFHLLPRQRID